MKPSKTNNYIEHKLELSATQTVRTLVEDIKDRPTCALVFGDKIADGCLVRIHSRCLYGDVFHSIDCDCRDQLDLSMELISKEGSGVIIYLDQEGRDCGLANKASGYALTQTKNLDTFDAYNTLGLVDDAREYSSAVRILKYLGLTAIRLLTNNPLKISAIEAAEIHVERIPIDIRSTNYTKGYLSAKKKRGHLIRIDD